MDASQESGPGRKGGNIVSRLNINTPNTAQQVVEGLYRDVERRIIAARRDCVRWTFLHPF